MTSIQIAGNLRDYTALVKLRRLTNKDQIGGLWQQLCSMSGARDMIKQLRSGMGQRHIKITRLLHFVVFFSVLRSCIFLHLKKMHLPTTIQQQRYGVSNQSNYRLDGIKGFIS